MATAGRSETGSSIRPTFSEGPLTWLAGAGNRLAERIVWLCSAAACLWILGYILFRSVQPYPLDTFEEYELHKVVRWQRGAPLYGSVESEVLPEAYPPLHFWLSDLLLRWFGSSFAPLRLLSLLALAGTVGAGWWSLRDSDASKQGVARLALLSVFLSFHALVGKMFEVGKPDMLLTMFLALAVAAGEHRTRAEVLLSSAALWLASMTKQNAPLFLIPLCLAQVLAGRRRWAIGWGTAMSLLIAGSYWLLDRIWEGAFFHWVFVWTAGHGIDWWGGIGRALRAIVLRGPVLLALLAGSSLIRPRCRWTWCLVTALGVAVMGMAKSGGRENHLLPAAFIAATIAARWAADSWNQASPNAGQRAWRWMLVGVLAATVGLGLPSGRDIRWVGKRAQELDEWVDAVSRIEGSVAVGHNFLLARRAGADCFFSDLILEFPGLVVPQIVREQIEAERFDYLVLGADPNRSPTTEWAELIAEHYVPAGELNCPNRSGVLPRGLYQARRLVDPAVAQ